MATVWGYDAALYMPLFQFARLNRIPMIALNVERKLVSRVGQQGWEGVPAAEREGLSDPAPPVRPISVSLLAFTSSRRHCRRRRSVFRLSGTSLRSPTSSGRGSRDATRIQRFVALN